jgi:hypothetical protein
MPDQIIPKPDLREDIAYMGNRVRLFQDIDGNAFCVDAAGMQLSRAMLLSQAYYLAKCSLRIRLQNIAMKAANER